MRRSSAKVSSPYRASKARPASASFTLEESTRDALDSQGPRPQSALFKDDLEGFLRAATEEENNLRRAAFHYKQKLMRIALAAIGKATAQRKELRRLEPLLAEVRLKRLFAGFIALRRFAFLREKTDSSAEHYYRRRLKIKALTSWSATMVEKYRVLEQLGSDSQSKFRSSIRVVEVAKRHLPVLSFGSSPEKAKNPIQFYDHRRKTLLKTAFSALYESAKKKAELHKRENYMRRVKTLKRFFSVWIQKKRRVESEAYAGLKTIAGFVACYKVQRAFGDWRSATIRGKKDRKRVIGYDEAQARVKSMSDEDLILQISQLEAHLSSLQQQVTTERMHVLRTRG